MTRLLKLLKMHIRRDWLWSNLPWNLDIWLRSSSINGFCRKIWLDPLSSNPSCDSDILKSFIIFLELCSILISGNFFGIFSIGCPSYITVLVEVALLLLPLSFLPLFLLLLLQLLLFLLSFPPLPQQFIIPNWEPRFTQVLLAWEKIPPKWI